MHHLKLRLIFEMALQEIRYRYRGSSLGLMWVILQPILTVAVLCGAIQYGLRVRPSSQTSTVLWILTGFLPWMFFSESLLQGTNSIVEKAFLLKKVRFPFFDLPLIKVLSGFIIHLVLLVILLVLLLLTGHGFVMSPSAFYFIFCNFAFAFAVVRMTSIIQVVLRDLQQIVQFGLTILFWMSPVFWNPHNLDSGGIAAAVVRYNPLNLIISGYRSQFIPDVSSELLPTQHIAFWGFTAVLWLISLLAYAHLKDEITDYL